MSAPELGPDVAVEAVFQALDDASDALVQLRRSLVVVRRLVVDERGGGDER